MDLLVPFAIFVPLGVVTLFAVARLAPSSERAFLIRLLLAAFALRILAASAFELFSGLRIFHEDAYGYETFGQRIAAGWHGDAPPYHFLPGLEQNLGYFYFCACLYYVMGQFRAVPAMFNALAGSVVVCLVYITARELAAKQVARRAALLTAFFPSMILWSSMAIKDTPVTLLIVIALLSCIRIKQRFSVGALLGITLPIVCILPMRFYIIYFLAPSIAGALMFERGRRVFSGVPKQLLFVGMLAVLLTVVGLSGQAASGTDFLDLEKVSTFRHGMATTANSGFSESVDISTPLGALGFLPIGLSVLLLAPFPWQFTSLRASFAAPEMIVWWFLFPSTIRGFYFVIRKNFARSSPLLLFSVALLLGYSLIHGNVGSGFRQRAQIFVFLFIFTGIGQYVRRCRRAGIPEESVLAGSLRGSAT